MLAPAQFGRANAPMIPQLVQTMRGPKAGTGIAFEGIHVHYGLVVA